MAADIFGAGLFVAVWGLLSFLGWQVIKPGGRGPTRHL